MRRSPHIRCLCFLGLAAALLSACAAPAATVSATPVPSATPAAATALATPAPATATPESATAPPAPVTVAPTIREYDLGPAIIEQAQVSGERHNLPYRIQGIIAAPANSGVHPLIVITHGSHQGCPAVPNVGDLEVDSWPCPADQEQRNDLGWRYLLEALAGQGYIVIAPNMNAVNTLAWGGLGSTYERYAAILDTHLGKLQVANQAGEAIFGLDLAGKIDFSRTAIVGHSQGGGYAMIYADQRSKLPADPLVAALLVAPAFQLVPTELSSNPNAVPIPDLPLAIVMGLCDGDVVGLEGFIYYQAARDAAQRANMVQVALPYGANHNFFNAALGPDGLSHGAPGCDRPAGRLSPEQQQAFLAAYAQDFFAQAFEGAAPAAAWHTDAPAPEQLYGTPVLTALLVPSAQRRPLLQIADDQLPGDPAGVRVSADTPIVAQVCGPHDAPCRLSTYAIPSFEIIRQMALRLSWERPGGGLRLDLPTGQQDLSTFSSIQMRVALDGYDAANVAGQSFRLQLRDSTGAEATITLPAKLLALQMPSVLVREANQPGQYLQGNAPLASIRVPLAEFGAIDLSTIETVSLLFDQRDRGALLLSDLELLR